MADQFDRSMVSPPAPGQDGAPARENPLQGNALYQPAPNSPAPDHQQTVAALRHFDAIMDELKVLKKNPDLGRASIKSAITDGVIKLVSARMLSPAEAVQQLSAVPEDPLQQRKWVEQMWQQTI